MAIRIRIALLLWLVTLGSLAHAQTIDAFDAGFPANQTGPIVWAIAIQPDGKILIGGLFTHLGTGCGGVTCPAARRNVARLNPDGSLDLAFNPGVNGVVRTIAVAADGRILIGGDFFSVGGGDGMATPRRHVARLLADGSVDLAFNPDPDSSVEEVVVQPDGRILIGGSFTSFGNSPSQIGRNRLARLNDDGTVDAGFDPGANGPVRTIAVQRNGQILVGGGFTTIGGGGTGTISRSLVARLDSQGIPDAFDPGVVGPESPLVFMIRVQADDRILIAGRFRTVAGATRVALARVLSSGAVDTSFVSNLSFLFPEFTTVNHMALQADGKIVLNGAFESIDSFFRRGIGRLHPDGSADAGFDIVLDEAVDAVALDAEGRLVVGGSFRIPEGSPRNALARYLNTDPAPHALTATSGGTVITWLRGGAGAQLDRVAFETTLDGLTWSHLGDAAPVPAGWELTGQNVPPTAVVRARGFVQGSIIEDAYLPTAVNLVENPGFVSGTTSWLQFGSPAPTDIVGGVVDGVFEFYRAEPPPGTTNQAVVLQMTGMPVPAGAGMQLELDLGNSSTVRKRIGVLLHDANFSDYSFCTFWLEPQAPLRTYRMTTHSTMAFMDAAVSFYAASVGSHGGFYRLDNVSLQYVPGAAPAETICTDPTAAPPPGGPAAPDLLVNGDFGSGQVLPGWQPFGLIDGVVNGGVFEFVKLPGAPAGVLLQDTFTTIGAGEILTAAFQLGNSSPVRKRVTAIVHDRDFSDLFACTFWLPAGAPLQTYLIRGRATRLWPSAVVSFYPATVGPDRWIRLDNVTVQQTPGSPAPGISCIGP